LYSKHLLAGASLSAGVPNSIVLIWRLQIVV
jgi:hypothetical protein